MVVADSVLEPISQSGAAVLEQLGGVAALGVLGEDDDAG